jgi:hypothetical protein
MTLSRVCGTRDAVTTTSFKLIVSAAKTGEVNARLTKLADISLILNFFIIYSLITCDPACRLIELGNTEELK